MAQYELLQDLPFADKGSIWDKHEIIDKPSENFLELKIEKEIRPRIWIDEILNFSKWFKEIKWKPQKDEIFFYITSSLGLSKFIVGHQIWIDHQSDRDYYDNNNCFRTLKEAKEKLDKIKEILKG